MSSSVTVRGALHPEGKKTRFCYAILLFCRSITIEYLIQTGSVATAITSPAKNALMQKNIRILSTLVMAFPSSNWERDGGAKAALLQSFADNGVRPVLRGRIKSNQMPKWDPRY
jgi:hypothetical protein